MRIEASGVVAASPETVFAFLADLDQHWRLADDFELLKLNGGDGGRVRMRGPFGIRRTADTHVTDLSPPHGMSGTARLGSRTHARVSWGLRPIHGGRTCLELSAEVLDASLLDRLLLAAGGRAWLERHFARIIERLATLACDDRLEEADALGGSRRDVALGRAV